MQFGGKPGFEKFRSSIEPISMRAFIFYEKNKNGGRGAKVTSPPFSSLHCEKNKQYVRWAGRTF